MRCRPQLVVAAASMGVLAALVGCAMSTPADLGPDVNPNLPGLDAAGSSHPSDPGADGSTSLDESDDAGDGDAAKATNGNDASTDSSLPPIGPAKPAPGEILVTEVMYSTTGAEPASEWIELHSLASSDRALTGLTLKDGASRVHVIGTLTIAANAYVVLARNKAAAITAKVPAAAIVYEYGTGLADSQGILLANGSTGGIALYNGGTLLVNAPYGGWFTQAGASVQLNVLTMTAETAKASWCLSANPWAAGADKGTPGAAEDCP